MKAAIVSVVMASNRAPASFSKASRLLLKAVDLVDFC
jgi:hypothetical protein